MKKHLFLLASAAVIAISLCACGKTSSEQKPAPIPTETAVPTDTPTPVPTDTPTPTLTPTPTFTPTPTDTPTPTPTDTPTPTPTEAPKSKISGLTMGISNGNVYENDFFNLRFTLNENMVFVDADKLVELNSSLKETEFIKNNEVAQELLDEGNLLIVAYAADLQTGLSFNVGIQNIGLLPSIVFNERTFLEAQISTIPQALESQGFTDVEAEIYDLILCNESHPTMVVSSLIKGYPFYEVMFVSIKSGYAALYTYSGFDLNAIANMLDAIEKIK